MNYTTIILSIYSLWGTAWILGVYKPACVGITPGDGGMISTTPAFCTAMSISSGVRPSHLQINKIVWFKLMLYAPKKNKVRSISSYKQYSNKYYSLLFLSNTFIFIE